MWRTHSSDTLPFRDREDAGQQLAIALEPLVADIPRERLIVLGLARGGVVLADQVATTLGIAMDTLVIRKIGSPTQPELAIGAVGPGNRRMLNRSLIESIGLSRDTVGALTDTASAERERLDRALRGNHPLPNLTDRMAILVDDGLATGATMRAAWAYVSQETSSVIIAVPVAPSDAITTFEQSGAHVVILVSADEFGAVGAFYDDFGEVASDRVRAILAHHVER